LKYRKPQVIVFGGWFLDRDTTALTVGRDTKEWLDCVRF
jgi:hypothetical protein